MSRDWPDGVHNSFRFWVPVPLYARDDGHAAPGTKECAQRVKNTRTSVRYQVSKVNSVNLISENGGRKWQIFGISLKFRPTKFFKFSVLFIRNLGLLVALQFLYFPFPFERDKRFLKSFLILADFGNFGVKFEENVYKAAFLPKTKTFSQSNSDRIVLPRNCAKNAHTSARASCC